MFCRIYFDNLYLHAPLIYRTFNNKQEVSILNKNDDLETICFASDEMLESIQLEDSTV